MHQRRIIRDAVAVLIAGGAPAFGGSPDNVTITDGIPAVGESRVFRSREAPAQVMTLLQEGPICNVYARKDHIKPEDYPKSGFDSGVFRTLDLGVEITAAGPWTADDKLDDLTDGVEGLLEAFEIPGLPSAEIRLASTQIDSTDEFDTPLGGALLTYEVRYFRPYRVDTSPEIAPCGGDLFIIANGTPAEPLPGCGS